MPHSTVNLDVHRGVRHVRANDAVGRTAHIVTARQAEAPSLGQLAFALDPSRALNDLVNAFRQTVTQHAQAVYRYRWWLQQVDAPHLRRIEVEFRANLVHL